MKQKTNLHMVGYYALAKQILSTLEGSRLCPCLFLAAGHLGDSLLSTLSELFDPFLFPVFLYSISGTR